MNYYYPGPKTPGMNELIRKMMLCNMYFFMVVIGIIFLLAVLCMFLFIMLVCSI